MLYFILLTLNHIWVSIGEGFSNQNIFWELGLDLRVYIFSRFFFLKRKNGSVSQPVIKEVGWAGNLDTSLGTCPTMKKSPGTLMDKIQK